MPQTGKIVGGKYRLLRQLGEGGMGVVYEAEHVRLGGRVAVKFLQRALEENSNAVERFEREARAAVSVGHEGVIGIQDIGITEDATHFIVMELLRGRSLGTLLSEEDRLDIPFASYIGCQVLSALSAVHDAGIVHRDLKPENVFLVETGAPVPGVKLLDFGISQIMTGKDSVKRLTETGVILGTPEFMSPEQARGNLDIDRRGDIFSLGVILYECLTGRVPFSGENYNAVLASILLDPTPELQSFRSNIPDKLQAVVLRALEKDRDERFQDAAEMFTQLKAFVADYALFRIPPPVDPLTASVDAVLGEDTEKYDLPEAHTPAPTDLDDDLDDDLESSPTIEILLKREPGASTHPTDEHDAEENDSLGLADTEPMVRGNNEDSTPSRRRVGGRAFLIAVVGVILFGGGVLIVQQQRVSSAPPVPTPIEAATSSEQREIPNETSRPQSTISIILEKLPEDAEVFLDEATVAAHPLELKKGSAVHTIRVELDGHEPFKRDVVPDRDRTIEVKLVPTDSTRREKRARRRRLDHRRKSPQKRVQQHDQETKTNGQYEPHFFQEER